MPTFIDESGDTGPVAGGGKPYFRLAAVWVPTLDDADAIRGAIRQLRRDLGLRANYEFKFSKTHLNRDRRKAFFAAALEREFRFAVSLIDKTVESEISASHQAQHWACATELAALLRRVYYRAEEEKGSALKEMVIVDDNSDAGFLDTIRRQFGALRSVCRPESPIVAGAKVKFSKSTTDEMLQLADMVCGAVGDFVDGVDEVWYKLIAERDIETR